MVLIGPQFFFIYTLCKNFNNNLSSPANSHMGVADVGRPKCTVEDSKPLFSLVNSAHTKTLEVLGD